MQRGKKEKGKGKLLLGSGELGPRGRVLKPGERILKMLFEQYIYPKLYVIKVIWE